MEFIGFMQSINNPMYKISMLPPTGKASTINFTGNEAQSSKGYILPEIKGQIINDANSSELNSLKLTFADKIRYSKLGIKENYFQKEALRLEHLFKNNSNTDLAKQYEKILLDVTELAKKTLTEVDPMATLSNKPINKGGNGYYVVDGFTNKSVNFYDPVKLNDGTVLSLNNIKAGCQGAAAKLKNCPEYVLSVIDTKGQHAFVHAHSVGNISLMNGLIDYMARIASKTVKTIC